MSIYHWCMATLALLALPALAQEPPITVPTSQRLVIREITTAGITVDDTTNDIGGYFYSPTLNNGDGRVMLGATLTDVRLRDRSLHISWLPVSVFVVPYRTTATFTKTGAAQLTAVRRLPDQTTDLGGGRTEVVTRRSRTITRLPEATTTFSYTPTMVYLTASANLGDLVDFEGPRRLTNERVGIGILRGRRSDIADGVTFDVDAAQGREGRDGNEADRAYAPNQGVRVATRGIEVGRSLERGNRGWYLLYAVGWQGAPR